MPHGDWIEAHGANAKLVERTARRWAIEVQESSPNATLLLKMSHYPLWQAYIDGQPVPLTANADGLQELTLPEGGPYTLEVLYREGLPEYARPRHFDSHSTAQHCYSLSPTTP